MKKWLGCLALPLASLIIWSIMVRSRAYSPLLIPAPTMVGRTLVSLLYPNAIFIGPDFLASLFRVTIGLGLGVSGGLVLGLLGGSSALAGQVISGPVDFVRSIPATALLPLFLLFCGVGDASKIASVVLTVGLIMTVQTMAGIKQMEATRRSVGRTMRLSRWVLFSHILLPDALPAIMSGIRLSLSFALILVVVSEMFIGTDYGLGQRILQAQLLYHTEELYAVIIFTGIFGYLINRGFIWLETRVIHWKGKLS